MLNELKDDNIVKPSLIAAHLGRLQHERLLVSIGISGTNNSFNSMLVSVDADKHTMLLDVLHPEPAHKQLMKNKRFVFNVVHDGVKISFKGIVKELVEDDGKPAYLVDFPEILIYQQRRQAFRAPISKDTLLTITLTDANKDISCEGIINNISRDGVCLQFDHTEKFSFEKLTLLSGQFFTDKKIEINCDVEIRNIVVDSTFRHTTVGVQFRNLTKLDKRNIQNFALTMERRMLKRKRA